jgi:hypothetical protein
MHEQLPVGAFNNAPSLMRINIASLKRLAILFIAKTKMENHFRNSPFLKIIRYTYLLPPILASMLKVACGTARKRALSISLPVTRHTP